MAVCAGAHDELGIRITVIGVDRHHAGDHPVDFRGEVGPPRPCRRRHRRQPSRQVAGRIVPNGEWRPTGQAPVQRPAQAVDVGANVHGTRVLGLFRRHVIDGPEDGAGFRLAVAEMARQAEVEQFGLPIRHELHVRRLDVAMH